jgi:hypothetical protein
VLIMTMPTRGWIDRPTNRMYVEDLRSKLAQEDGGLIVFFGAGVSFGVTRSRGRFDFESHNHGGDTEPFPSWEALVARMLATLTALPDLHEREAELESFFREQNAFDCAQLFKQQVGDADFFEFLRLQYTSARARRTTTPSPPCPFASCSQPTSTPCLSKPFSSATWHSPSAWDLNSFFPGWARRYHAISSSCTARSTSPQPLC